MARAIRKAGSVRWRKSRDRFVAELQGAGQQEGSDLQGRKKRRGKGGHSMVWVGDKVTTLPSREIDPKTAKKILKAAWPG